MDLSARHEGNEINSPARVYQNLVMLLAVGGYTLLPQIK